MSNLPNGYPREPDDLIDNSQEDDPDDAYEAYRASRDEALEEDAGIARQEARDEDGLPPHSRQLADDMERPHED